MRKFMTFTALSLAVLATACGKKDNGVEPCTGDNCPVDPPPPPPPPPTGGPGVVVAAAGNIAAGNGNSHLTAQIIDTLGASAQVIALGDNDRCAGSTYSCFDGSWGRFKARMRGAIGNHEYDAVNTNADAFFAYFGATAGNPGEGWYAYDVGDWRVIVLNVTDQGASSTGTGPRFNLGSPQANWLAGELQTTRKKCTLAVLHNSFQLSSNSTTANGNPFNSRSSVQGIFGMLASNGVDVVLSANEHWYERFAPVNGSGSRDDANGARIFNVGTGGEAVDGQALAYMNPNSEMRIANFGVLRLNLKTDGYDFAFINAQSPTTTDAGSGSCH